MKAITMIEEDFINACEMYQGYCVRCGAFTHDCSEPDARQYTCPVCGMDTVYGAEEALMMGLISFE